MSAKRSFDCPHGLDMRLHPRCYLCTPLEWVQTTRVFTPPAPVPVCSCVWFGTVRPSCPVHNPVITWTYTNTAATATATAPFAPTSGVCVCPVYGWLSSCPVHSQMWGKP